MRRRCAIPIICGFLCAAGALACAQKGGPRRATDPILHLRYPDGRQTTAPAPPVVSGAGEDLVVTSERARLVFSRRCAAVVEATLMGREIPLVSIPDARVVDAEGRVYRQHEASDGTLRVHAAPWDKYLHLEGSCTPRGEAGDAPLRLGIRYDIHKATGFTLVHVTVDPSPGTRIREFAMEHALGPDATKLFPWVQMLGNGLLADVNSSPPDEPGVIFADTLPFALWSNGVSGLELTSISYENSVIDPSYMATSERHYMTVGTHEDGSRAIDMVFVRVPAGRAVELASGTTFTYALSFLPWRKFRPLYELYAGRFDLDVYEESDNPDPRVAARAGITSSFSWELAFRGQHTLQRELHWTEQANRYGMQLMRYVDHQTFQPKFSDQRSAVSDQRLAQNSELGTQNSELELWDRLWGWKIWYPADQVREDLLENRWTARDFKHYSPEDGIPFSKWPHDPEGSVTLCINSERARNFFFDWIKDWIDLEPTGLVYIDDFGPIICSNTRHGCSAQGTSMALGDHLLVERLHDAFQDYNPRIRLLLHMINVFNNSVALADYTNPGEQVPAGIPERAELDVVYSPFLRGTQIIWYTASYGNKPNNDLRLYERALSRCGLVLFNQRYPHEMTAEQKTWFAKYLCPLGVYDVEHSTVRHPFEPEYPDYARADTDLITPVIYERPGDVLLVVVKNQDQCNPKSVTLNAAFLGLEGDEVLVFDTVARSGQRVPIRDGKIVLNRVRVDEGPQVFRIVSIPQEPSIIWHDQVAWRVISSRFDAQDGFRARLCGVPQSRALVYLHLADLRKPDGVEGAEIADYDPQSGILMLAVDFSVEALAEIRMDWRR